MASSADIERAKRGRDVWNSWADADRQAERHARVDFSGVELNLDFDGFQFPGVADFSGATFSEGGSFTRAVFRGPALFRRANFSGATSFAGANLIEAADFSRSRFSDPAHFAGVNFSDSANFSGAYFRGVVDFSNATFNKRVDFSSIRGGRELDNGPMPTTFKGGAIFRRTMFSADAWFYRAIFEKHATFQNAQFKMATFDGASFDAPPDFRGADFASPAHFQNCTIDYACDKNAKLWRRWMRSAHDDDAACFRRLRQLASDARDHERELSFFANELRAKRFHETVGFWPIALNVAYDWLSKYGQSIARPAVWLIALTVLAMSLIARSYWTTSTDPLSKLSATFALAMTNVGLLLGADKWAIRLEAFKLLKNVDALTIGTFGVFGDLLAYGQSAISLVLLFFVGLALRNRFRIGSN